MKFLRLATENPFIFATAIAAFIHSAWSLSILFEGAEPNFGFNWLLWLVPGFLVAVSIDVGQVYTASEIRSGSRNRTRLATFAMICIFTYFLQWFYLSHHMIKLPLGEGVPMGWREGIQLISDTVSLWGAPAALPLLTLFYTFASQRKTPANREKSATATEVQMQAGFAFKRAKRTASVAAMEVATQDASEVHRIANVDAKALPERASATCKQCDMQFPDRFKLAAHVRYSHPKVKVDVE